MKKNVKKNTKKNMKNNSFYFNVICKFLLCSLCFLMGCKEALLHNLSEIQVNRLIGILNSEGIEAKKELQADAKWTLLVEKKDLINAISLLDSKRLLKDNTSNIKETSSVLGSNQEKNFYYERVLSAELEKTLLTLSGVFDARVHLNIKKNDILSLKKDDKEKTSASVLMVVSDKEKFDEEKIKSIISGASGIDAKDVSIVISKINVLGDKKNNSENNILVANSGILESSKATINGSRHSGVLGFIKNNYYYFYLILGVALSLVIIKNIKKYKNNKKLDLIKTVSIIGK
ncbi:MAG: hypothetical protein ACOX3T_08055 [Bdellovibrionota bacterium]